MPSEYTSPASAWGERTINFLAVEWYMKQDFSAFVMSISKSADVILLEIEFQAHWILRGYELGGIIGILSRYFGGLWARPFTYSREIIHILRGFQDSRQKKIQEVSRSKSYKMHGLLFVNFAICKCICMFVICISYLVSCWSQNEC